jgi:hypothetical protein
LILYLFSLVASNGLIRFFFQLFQIGMDPTLVKGKKGSGGLSNGGAGDFQHQIPINPNTVYLEPLADNKDESSSVIAATSPPPPIPPLTPLGAADSATWLRFKADLLKYKGLQMQYQANLLERQARILQQQQTRDVTATHAHLEEVEEGKEDMMVTGRNSCYPMERADHSVLNFADGRNSAAAVAAAAALEAYSDNSNRSPRSQLSMITQQPRFYMEPQQQQYSGLFRRESGPDTNRSSLSGGSASSATPPASVGGGDEEEMEEEEEDAEDEGPIDLSSCGQQQLAPAVSSQQLPHFQQLQQQQQQTSHMRYSTMPRIFFRHQQEVGSVGVAYSC